MEDSPGRGRDGKEKMACKTLFLVTHPPRVAGWPLLCPGRSISSGPRPPSALEAWDKRKERLKNLGALRFISPAGFSSQGSESNLSHKN